MHSRRRSRSDVWSRDCPWGPVATGGADGDLTGSRVQVGRLEPSARALETYHVPCRPRRCQGFRGATKVRYPSAPSVGAGIPRISGSLRCRHQEFDQGVASVDPQETFTSNDLEWGFPQDIQIPPGLLHIDQGSSATASRSWTKTLGDRTSFQAKGVGPQVSGPSQQGNFATPFAAPGC